jgi:hypothetical protein
VFHNGIRIHQLREIENLWNRTPEDGPIWLQDHGNPVFFRNIWIVESVPEEISLPVAVASFREKGRLNTSGIKIRYLTGRGMAGKPELMKIFRLDGSSRYVNRTMPSPGIYITK